MLSASRIPCPVARSRTANALTSDRTRHHRRLACYRLHAVTTLLNGALRATAAGTSWACDHRRGAYGRPDASLAGDEVCPGRARASVVIRRAHHAVEAARARVAPADGGSRVAFQWYVNHLDFDIADGHAGLVVCKREFLQRSVAGETHPRAICEICERRRVVGDGDRAKHLTGCNTGQSLDSCKFRNFRTLSNSRKRLALPICWRRCRSIPSQYRSQRCCSETGRRRTGIGNRQGKGGQASRAWHFDRSRLGDLQIDARSRSDMHARGIVAEIGFDHTRRRAERDGRAIDVRRGRCRRSS